MHAPRRHFAKHDRTSLIAWITILALLLASLAPVLRHARMQSPGVGWIEMCSAAGNKWVKLDAQGQIVEKAANSDAAGLDVGRQDAEGKQGHGGHCAMCTQDHDPGLALPQAGSSHYRITLTPGHPALFYQAPQGLFVWTPQQSRAPPQVT